MAKIKIIDSIMGSGKAQPLDSLILSDNGFVKMKDIAVGSKVYGEDGNLHTVTGVYPQGYKDVYKITLSDGSIVESCDEHLWTYQKPQDKSKNIYRTEPLKEIMKSPLYKNTNRGDKNWQIFIPLTKPINFEKKELIIHPYVIGVLIGDGGISNLRSSPIFTNSEQDILLKLQTLLGDEYSLNQKPIDIITYSITDLKQKRNNVKGIYTNRIKNNLSSLGLLGKKSDKKFIPKDYLYSCVEDRIEILRGLIDTDGEVDNSNIVYSSTSLQLSLDVQFLVQSLGGTAKISKRQTKFTYKGIKKYGKPSYRIHIKMNNDIKIFSSVKHSKNYKIGNTNPKRTICKIDYIGKKECQCIMVDNPSNLYLTNDFVVTHNTNWSFKYMYENTNKRFIYITPFLSEITRLVGDGSEEKPYTKHYYERRFREPKNIGDGKLNNLNQLLEKKYNIATTHTLFKMFDKDTIKYIKDNKYTLILDEALDVMELKEYSAKDYNMLLDTGKIKVKEDRSIEWLDNDYDGRLKDIMDSTKNGVVTELEIRKKVKLLSWVLSKDFFDSFSDVYVMTYLFDMSLLSFYFKIYNMEYEKLCIENNNLVKFEEKKPYNKDLLKRKIHIYEGSINTVGDKHNALSYSWLRRNVDLCDNISKHMHDFFQNINKAKGNEIIWTTFKEFRKNMEYKGFVKRFVPLNAKATNEYQDCKYIAYCCNRYLNPEYEIFLSLHGYTLNSDMFALSELIQFIWRSRIRKRIPEDIYIYLPSSRMRKILKEWLDNPYI